MTNDNGIESVTNKSIHIFMEDNYPKLKLQSKKSCQGNGNPLMRIAIDVLRTHCEYI